MLFEYLNRFVRGSRILNGIPKLWVALVYHTQKGLFNKTPLHIGRGYDRYGGQFP